MKQLEMYQAAVGTCVVASANLYHEGRGSLKFFFEVANILMNVLLD